MSGIYIPGMDMPKSCGECLDIGWQYVFECRLDDVEEGERLPNCPLVPVPEHGRLIDADALAEMLEKYKKEYALKAKEDIVHLHKAWGLHEAELMAESSPTFIPADPADEEGE